MDTLLNVAHGFGVALQPVNLIYCFIGVFIGTLVGVLPGIGPISAMSLLLPITLSGTPESGIIMMAGIYYGSMYGGSTTSILLNTPGEAGSMVTAMEGNKMAKSGRAGAALATAVGRNDEAADELRQRLRPALIRQLDDELADTSMLVDAFRGKLDV